nr:IS21 family transposase [Alkalibaculum sporogenes]
MDKHTIIKLKKEGCSNRNISKMFPINRKTVAKYWNEYVEQQTLLEVAQPYDVTNIQEKICEPPAYHSENRSWRKYSTELDDFIDEILEDESEKCKLLGTRKQQLTQLQIYQIIKEKGFDISCSTVTNKIREKRNKTKECFIRQDYEFGDRLEYDFGEVKLVIDGVLDTYHIAVLSSPASNFRWAYLYKNQKQEVFMDSHIKFFEMIGGIYKEVVYDNMRNVVSRFIGRHEKELNSTLLKLSLYYGFDINVTNCFSGNEKGHVEGSVKIIRNKVFAKHYCFKTYEDACSHLMDELIVLNIDSSIQEEVDHLLPPKPPLELADLKEVKVNKYSFIRVENSFYSVPEYLVDKQVQAKVYFDRIIVFSNLSYVCEHKKIDGTNEISIDINHYLNTFAKKPGALRNSLALKSIPQLKSIYDTYFNKNPREFIELIQNNKDKNIEELVEILQTYTLTSNNIIKFKYTKDTYTLGSIARKQTSKYNDICIRGK